jgi:hypothetical protein
LLIFASEERPWSFFWLKNRDPQHWRDSQQLEHVLGKYINQSVSQ